VILRVLWTLPKLYQAKCRVTAALRCESLAERIRQTGQSAHLHSRRQILALDKRCADMFVVGVALANLGYNLCDWVWGVPFISVLAVVAVQLCAPLRFAEGCLFDSLTVSLLSPVAMSTISFAI
jgi:hypothetical protein